MTMPRRRNNFNAPRELLLTEVARRCRACDAGARLGLTKEEARAYHGFECERCKEWNEDDLSERDIPEWWEELRVTGLDALRARALATGAQGDAAGEPDAIKRLSDAWREGDATRRTREDEAEGGSF